MAYGINVVHYLFFMGFSSHFKKIKRRIFCDTWKLYKIQMSVSIVKFYWNSAKPIHVCIVYDCFHAAKVKSLQQRQYGKQSLKYFLSSTLKKTFSNPWSRSIFYVSYYNSKECLQVTLGNGVFRKLKPSTEKNRSIIKSDAGIKQPTTLELMSPCTWM